MQLCLTLDVAATGTGRCIVVEQDNATYVEVVDITPDMMSAVNCGATKSHKEHRADVLVESVLFLRGRSAWYILITLISTAQKSQNGENNKMPKGVPVATVAIGGAENAALLAIQIMGGAHPDLREAFRAYKVKMDEEIKALDAEMNA